MRQRKTYRYCGNLMEWHGTLHLGNKTMKASFTGGFQTAYGVNPATFTTDSQFTQLFIEKSVEFASGLVELANVVEIPGDYPANDNPSTTTVEESHEEVPAEKEEASDNDGFIDVTVADKDDAIGYLNEHFGNKYTKTGLRNKGDFMAACAECKVNFIYSE